jgi:hypothetical protein
MKNSIFTMFSIALLVLSIGVASAKSKDAFDENLVNSAIAQGIDKINSNQKYLDFISDSTYDACKVIIGEKEYYFNYDGEKVIQSTPINVDFEVSISYKKFKKAVDNYNNKNYGLVMITAANIYNKLPKEVKKNLKNQCRETDWCRKGDF